MSDLFDQIPDPQDATIEPRPWMKKGEVYKIIVAVSEDGKTMVLRAPHEVWEYLREADGSWTELGTSRDQEGTPGIFLVGVTYRCERDYEGCYDEGTDVVSWERIFSWPKDEDNA